MKNFKILRDKMEKQRITVQISAEVIERVKNAVYWTPGLTLAKLAEDALTAYVNVMERNKGHAFIPRKEELTCGRPLKGTDENDDPDSIMKRLLCGNKASYTPDEIKKLHDYSIENQRHLMLKDFLEDLSTELKEKFGLDMHLVTKGG